MQGPAIALMCPPFCICSGQRHGLNHHKQTNKKRNDMKKPQNEPQATVRKISTERVRRPMMGFDGINDVKKNFFFQTC